MTEPASPVTAPLPEVAGGAVRITKDAPAEQTRVVLFYVGDDAYTIPKVIPANMGLSLIQIAAHRGSGAAQVFLMEDMLGEDAMRALRECDGMTTEQFAELRDKFDRLMAGQIDELLNPKGSASA